MRIAIVGSREYSDFEEVREYVRSLPKDTVVVTGGARGVDNIAADEANKCGLDVVVHLANWDLHGKKAGPIRNAVVVEDCDKLKAFWDGDSPGTRDVVAKARRAGKLLPVSRPPDPFQGELF